MQRFEKIIFNEAETPVIKIITQDWCQSQF